MKSELRFERVTSSSDGVELVWFDYGEPGGRTLALVHGLAAGADQFDADARHFAGKGFRVIVPDLRGHGRSGKPASKDYSIARMAQDLLEIFEDAGAGPIDYVGNSLGGILALHLLKDHATCFNTLTTFGTAPALNLPGFTSALIPLSYRLAGKTVVSRLTAHVTTPAREGREVVAALIRTFDPEVGKAVGGVVSRYDLSANVLACKKPLLIIRGARDRAVNRKLDPALAALDALPNVTIVRMDGAGHCANLDQPELFRQTVLDFIAGQPD
ncbi:alpha/beta fold hydrolase [Pelagibacterium limicola]|uniref:alpha/beta fold hydrolase n=1 Tax=Pelagibacterium limicola TaxID=2791022 RepID=UPI0018AFDE05|nr:alpha/beta hydrolase [Pelagibacterium limicola]